MSDTKEVEFVLKVMANKQNNKLLFLEAGSDFTDVIFSFLTLPLGTIVRVLNQHYGDEKAPPIIGSLTSLYNGVADLESDNFLSEGCKAMLLTPRSSSEYECRQLKIDIKNGSFEPAKYFCCEDVNCVHYRRVNISMHYDAPVCRCGKSLKRELVIRDSSGNIDDGGGGGSGGGGGGGGIFTVKRASFLMSGDMRVVPNVGGSVIKTLGNLGITDAEGAEPRNSTCRLNYIMSLLKDLLLTRMDSAAVKTEAGILFGEEEKEATRKSKKMVLNVMLQKSSNKLLFAQSEEDFIDFLFGLLVIPLGGVAFLLGGNTSLTKLDNLYRSVADINGDKYLINADTKNRLMNPKIPYGYMSKTPIFPLSEQTAPRLYYFSRQSHWISSTGREPGIEWLSYTGRNPAIEFRSGYGRYVRQGPTMYMVSDDLTVTPFTMTSTLSMLNKLKIPLSDVKEVKVLVGLQEALSILKASLTSTCALTNGLNINPIIKKQPKKERL